MFAMFSITSARAIFRLAANVDTTDTAYSENRRVLRLLVGRSHSPLRELSLPVAPHRWQ